MKSNQISIRNYGEYSSNNYGSSRMVSVGDMDLYFSYETIIAFDTPKTGLKIRQNSWGNTTGKHLNAINSDKKIRIPSEQFEKELEAMLSSYKLVSS